MPSIRRPGFTLVEVLIVVVIMAILAATIIPQFTDSTSDAKHNTAVFNLQTLRSQIELYRVHHGGNIPAQLEDLTVKTQADGTVDPNGSFGPYLSMIPEETINGSTAVSNVPTEITVGDAVTTGGWIYSSLNGQVRINHGDYDHL